ncbi:MAG: hypothetical protein WA849_14890 [Candidatus Udaeobacter sp.]
MNRLDLFGTFALSHRPKEFITSSLQQFLAKTTPSLVTRFRGHYITVSGLIFGSMAMGRRKKTTKRKLAHPTLPMQQQLNLRHEGTHFDLREIFNDLNERHFRKRLRGYKVVWGRRRKHRPREQFVFGTIQEEDRVIRINPALDQPFVPLWFLRYVLYHEMLHSVVPDETLSRNRRRVHTEEFNRREREFPGYRRARRWEDENLSRFLR